MAIFELGDLVRLKSGGPIMTVINVRRNGGKLGQTFDTICCTWYDGTKYSEHEFDYRMLVGAYDGPQSIPPSQRNRNSGAIAQDYKEHQPSTSISTL